MALGELLYQHLTNNKRQARSIRYPTKPCIQQDLFGKINEIKAKAAQTERVVIDICSDIKILDCAKKNLTNTIKALKKIHMLNTALDQLKIMVIKVSNLCYWRRCEGVVVM